MTAPRWMALGLGLALVASRAEAVEIKEVTTPLGIKAWLVEDSSAPVVALSFSFTTGSAGDPENEKGLTGLTVSLLTDGAGSLDAQAFEGMPQGGIIRRAGLRGLARIRRRLAAPVVRRPRRGLRMLRLAVTAPRFDPDRVEQRRADDRRIEPGRPVLGIGRRAHHDGDGVRGRSRWRECLGRA